MNTRRLSRREAASRPHVAGLGSIIFAISLLVVWAGPQCGAAELHVGGASVSGEMGSGLGVHIKTANERFTFVLPAVPSAAWQSPEGKHAALLVIEYAP